MLDGLRKQELRYERTRRGRRKRRPQRNRLSGNGRPHARKRRVRRRPHADPECHPDASGERTSRAAARRHRISGPGQSTIPSTEPSANGLIAYDFHVVSALDVPDVDDGNANSRNVQGRHATAAAAKKATALNGNVATDARPNGRGWDRTSGPMKLELSDTPIRGSTRRSGAMTRWEVRQRRGGHGRPCAAVRFLNAEFVLRPPLAYGAVLGNDVAGADFGGRDAGGTQNATARRDDRAVAPGPCAGLAEVPVIGVAREERPDLSVVTRTSLPVYFGFRA
jgi:hypothetical protein